jgi:hypothetical protein
VCGDGGWLGKYLRKRRRIDLEVIEYEQQARDAGEQRKRDEYFFARFQY